MSESPLGTEPPAGLQYEEIRKARAVSSGASAKSTEDTDGHKPEASGGSTTGG